LSGEGLFANESNTKTMTMRADFAPTTVDAAPFPTRVALSRRKTRPGSVSLPYALTILFVIALYSQVSLLFPVLEPLRPAQSVGLAALFALMVQKLADPRGVELIWPDSYLLLALLGAAALSCIGALWPRYALDNTLDLLKFAALYFLALYTVDNRQRFRTLLWVLVAGSLFPAIGSLRNYFEGNMTEGRAAWLGIFANPNELAYSLVILVPVVTYLATSQSFTGSLVLWGILGLYAAAIYVSFSRGGMLAFLVVALLLGLKTRARTVRMMIIPVLALSVVLMAYWWTRGENFNDLTSDLNVVQRLATFKAGLAMFADHPLTGVGLGCSLIAWPLYAPPDLYTRGWLIIHNTFVQVLSELGLFGFLAFILMIVAVLYRTRLLTLADSAERLPLGSALEVSLWGFIVCGLSGGYLLTWFPYLLFALVSCAWRIAQKEGEAAPC
jgi:O-antigen ligase